MSLHSKQRIAITGANGFIGKSLSLFLGHQGYEIHKILRPQVELTNSKLDHFCDLANPEDLKNIFSKIQPQMILHLASYSEPSRNLGDFKLQMDNTLSPAVSIALSAPEDTRLVAFFGSCEEYGSGKVPFREGQSPICVSPYGWGKISSQMAVTYISQQRKLNWCWLRPFLTFGPHQKGSRLIPTLIKSCVEKMPTQLTKGEQTRDFIYIEDLCQMVLKILEDAQRNNPQFRSEVINLCSGNPRTVREVAELIRKSVGSGDLLFGALPYRENEIMSFYGSTQKYESLFGKFKHTPFEIAVAKTVDWWQKNQYN